MADLTAIAEVVDRKTDALLARDLRGLRDRIIEALEAFGADTPARKVALVGELLAGSSNAEIAAVLPWTRAVRETIVVEEFESRIGTDSSS